MTGEKNLTEGSFLMEFKGASQKLNRDSLSPHLSIHQTRRRHAGKRLCCVG